MTIKARVEEVEIAPAHPAGAVLADGAPDPLACDQLIREWCQAHPDHHIYWVRYHPRPDGTLCVVMETSQTLLPLDGCPEEPTLGTEDLT